MVEVPRFRAPTLPAALSAFQALTLASWRVEVGAVERDPE